MFYSNFPTSTVFGSSKKRPFNFNTTPKKNETPSTQTSRVVELDYRLHPYYAGKQRQDKLVTRLLRKQDGPYTRMLEMKERYDRVTTFNEHSFDDSWSDFSEPEIDTVSSFQKARIKRKTAARQKSMEQLKSKVKANRQTADPVAAPNLMDQLRTIVAVSKQVANPKILSNLIEQLTPIVHEVQQSSTPILIEQIRSIVHTSMQAANFEQFIINNLAKLRLN